MASARLWFGLHANINHDRFIHPKVLATPVELRWGIPAYLISPGHLGRLSDRVLQFFLFQEQQNSGQIIAIRWSYRAPPLGA